jgi:hypothetical protein
VHGVTRQELGADGRWMELAQDRAIENVSLNKPRILGVKRPGREVDHSQSTY